ncbi:MAG TPA: hypothetical protein VM327_04340 [Candidatus Thermoplasmatota archaeon]|nr:hypothetical protein [Candidatus Thermoplasmatota archaeon]
MSRSAVAIVFLMGLSLSGCSGAGDDCEQLGARAVVQAMSGRDAHVLLDDGQPAVLHLSAAVFVSEGSSCTMTGPAGVRVGDVLTFEVDAWAESYPMQGWPETAVVVR